MKQLDERVERAVGSRPVHYEQRPGGYSTADRFAVALADGRSVFVKSAEAPNLAGFLRREHEVYAALSGSFIPELIGWDDDGVRPVLAIEDLSDADWTPRWDDARIAAVLAALEELADAVPPPNTPRLCPDSANRRLLLKAPVMRLSNWSRTCTAEEASTMPTTSFCRS